MSAVESPHQSPTGTSPDVLVYHGSRRSSLLDMGGENSINNFASSLRRSVNYLSTSAGSKATIDGEYVVPRTTPTYQIPPMDDQTPLLAPVKDDASEIVVCLKSTPVQTTFNAINVLIGLGILSVPLGFRLSGWFFGITILSLAAFTTRYTAILLGRIQSHDKELRTYHSIAKKAFGNKASLFVFAVFALDLYGANVTMVILFADSFNAIFQDVSATTFKIVLAFILLVLNALPLRILSVLSFAGIVCTTSTFAILLTAGLATKSQPGSLFPPAPTNFWPTSFLDLCFSLGLFLAPWGGHAAFPEVYTDQRHPEKYDRCMTVAFSFSYSLDLITGVVGFLMFGQLVQDEVTKNILLNDTYPAWITSTIVVLMGILPLSKLPLVCRPILSAANSFMPPFVARVALSIVLLVSSLLITNFGKIMSLLGSAICFTVCITLPLAFYLKLYGHELSSFHKTTLTLMAFVSIVLTVAGSLAVVLV